MDKILFSDGLQLDPEALVYVELPAQNETQAFNEDVWNYVRKGPDKPTLVRIKAKDVAIGEAIYNLEGVVVATRIG